MQIADRWALWNVANCVENFLLQTVLFQKLAVCRKMYWTVLLQSDRVLQQNSQSVIAAGCKEPAEEMSAPRPIGAVSTTLTLRLLMSYIYMELIFLMFLDHTRRSTVGRTPLDE